MNTINDLKKFLILFTLTCISFDDIPNKYFSFMFKVFFKAIDLVLKCYLGATFSERQL